MVGTSTTVGQVTGSYATGDVTVTDANGRAGGLLGRVASGADVYGSYATGDVRVRGGNSIAGGLVGKADGAGTTVNDSYATGAMCPPAGPASATFRPVNWATCWAAWRESSPPARRSPPATPPAMCPPPLTPPTASWAAWWVG